MINIFVSELFYCPIKSLSFKKSKNLIINPISGIKNDRILAFTRGLDKESSNRFNESNKRSLNHFLTLKNSPYLKKFNIIFDEKSNNIELFLNNEKLLKVNIFDKNETKKIEYFLESVDKKIKKPIYLIYNKESPFFDTTPEISVSLININSVKNFEKKINHQLDIERFRGNIIIDNLDPWEEFKLLDKNIKIGNVLFKVSSRIPRCSATNINPENYELDLNIPNKLINLYGHKDMGVYLVPKNQGIININDRVIVN